MIQGIFKKTFLILVLMVGVVCAQEYINPMELPQLTQHVTDFSSVLGLDQLGNINNHAKTYEDQTSNQLFVVLFPHRQGNELIDLGMKIFNANGIGQKDKNNGLLLLISTDEKKIRIIVGYGLEGLYSDLVASQIIEQDIRPLVNSGDFYGAVKMFYDKSEQIIAGEYVSLVGSCRLYTTTTQKCRECVNLHGKDITCVTQNKGALIFSILLMFLFGGIGFLLVRSFYSGQDKKVSKIKKKKMKLSLRYFFLNIFLAKTKKKNKTKKKKMSLFILFVLILPFLLSIFTLILFLFYSLGFLSFDFSFTLPIMFLLNVISFATGIGAIVKFSGGSSVIGGSGSNSSGGGGRSSGGGGGGSSGGGGSGGGGGGSSGGGGAGD